MLCMPRLVSEWTFQPAISCLCENNYVPMSSPLLIKSLIEAICYVHPAPSIVL